MMHPSLRFRRHLPLSCSLLLIAMVAGSRLGAAEMDGVQVLEPAHVATAVPRKPNPDTWEWNHAEATVTATGDLEWKPKAFAFTPGKIVHYIDFDHGDDSKEGSKTAPWKHHPWDEAATDNAKAATGPATYVFKRGVVYRGTLHPADGGVPGDPIQLTSDPSWGTGEAVIAGSEVVSGWQKGAGRADIPDADQVYYADIPYEPRAVWMVKGSDITRIDLARIPKWKVTDPEEVKSGWFRFEQPGWWNNGLNGCKIDFGGHRAHIGIDAADLTGKADDYIGATAHVEYGWVMGTPFPTLVEGFDESRKGVIFQGIWLGDSEMVTTGMHFYLEDKPNFLSSAGEFWFDRDKHRLYLRLPGDVDPSTVQVEAAQRPNLIDGDSMSHVAISGLSFRFPNYAWEMWRAPWDNKDINNACVRILGSAEDVRIANCRFDHCAKAVRIDAAAQDKTLDKIVFADNDIDQTDHGAIEIMSHSVGDVAVLRNHLEQIGLRTFRQDHSHALIVGFPQTMEIAGNVLDRCTGAGIFVFGGKPSGTDGEVPMARNLIHHNKVTQALLSACDWGSIETWQGGPFYTYDNISGDPNGVWNGFDPKKPGSGRLGFAYYHDGGYKNYDFNDVAYGHDADWTGKGGCEAAFYEATPTVENQIFNCTISRFWTGTQWSPAGGRHFFLGNIFDQIGHDVFEHGQLKEDTGPTPAAYPHASTAYGHNVFSNIPDKTVAVYEASGVGYDTIAAMAASFAAHPALASDVGTVAATSPLKDPEKHDFHLNANSGAAGKGVKVFVPWALARTVGEWVFRRNAAEVSRVFDSHWYLRPSMVERNDYHAAPVNDLHIESVAAADFTASPLENWCDGALDFDGKTRFATVTNADMSKPFDYVDNKENKSAQGQDLSTPDVATTSMIVELYLKAAAGQTGVVVSKMAGNGYQVAVNKAGSVTLTVVAGGTKAEVAGTAIIADGKWHHVLVELDRSAGKGSIDTDGVLTGQAKMDLPADASLSNDADFLVGKGPAGNFFTGAIGFLRVARSSLAESKTSIEELYDWEFAGPFLRDFAGKEPGKHGRDAGAFQGPE